MGIKDALTAPPPTRTKRIDKYLAAMDDDLRAAALELLHSDVPTSRVVDAFNEDGYPITANPVHDWRKANRGDS